MTFSFQLKTALGADSESESDKETPKRTSENVKSLVVDPSQQSSQKPSGKEKAQVKEASKPAEKEQVIADSFHSKPKPKFHVNYEFFDPGNHWCRKCNVVSNSVYEVFQHLQKKQHVSVSKD